MLIEHRTSNIEHRKRPGESVLLVIFLMFFVILSLVLGGLYWSVLTDQEQNSADKTAAVSDKEVAECERDWYKFQALMLREYMGGAFTPSESVGTPPERDELKRLRALFDDKKLGKPKDKNPVPDLDNVTRLFGELDTSRRWSTADKQCTNRYYDETNQWQKDKEELQKNCNTFNDLWVAEKGARNKAEDMRKAEAKGYAEKLKKQEDEFLADLAAREKSHADFLKLFIDQCDKLNAKITDLAARGPMQQINFEQEFSQLRKDVAELRTQVDKKKAPAAQTASTVDDTVLDGDAPKGQIVSLNEGKPYVNLREADNVVENLTFSIVGTDPNGRPSNKIKGALEIANPKTGEARYVGTAFKQDNPVQVNDRIFNPVWLPTAQACCHCRRH